MTIKSSNYPILHTLLILLSNNTHTQHAQHVKAADTEDDAESGLGILQTSDEQKA